MPPRNDIVGQSGYHSLFHWFESFLDAHFPDPMGVRAFLERYSLGVYPRILKYFMAAFDVPEMVAVGRSAICSSQGTWASLTRLQVMSSTPLRSTIVGCCRRLGTTWECWPTIGSWPRRQWDLSLGLTSMSPAASFTCITTKPSPHCAFLISKVSVG